jgi:hypothetical protein
MPEEQIAQSSETEGLEDAGDFTGEEIGLPPDSFGDADTETPDDATGADDGLSQEGEQSEDKDVAPDATEPAPEGETEKTSDAAQASQEPEPKPTAFYKYGDHEFKSPDEVGNYIKSVEGRQRTTQAAHQDALQKNGAWVDWSKDPAKVRSHLAELLGEKPEEVKVTDEKKTFLDATDWQQLKALVDKGEGMQALATMAHMFDQAMDNRLAQMEAKFTEQVQPMSDVSAARQATVSLFRNAENAMDPEGNLHWPEFNKDSEQFDPQFCQLFTRVWQQLPANIAWDDNLYGIEVAYNRTKALLAGQTPATEPGPTEDGNSAATDTRAERAKQALRDEQGRFVKQTEDAATAVGGSGAAPPPSQGPADSYSEAAILQQMDRVDADRDPVFGIRR